MESGLIHSRILEIRGQRVMLDFHLAEMDGVELRTLNQAVRRNIKRFPSDFVLQLHQEEYNSLRSQFVILEGSRVFVEPPIKAAAYRI
jgi:ORF6N domain